MRKTKTKTARSSKVGTKSTRVAQVKAIGLTISVIAAGVAVGLMRKKRRARLAGAIEESESPGRIDLSTSFLDQVAGDEAACPPEENRS
jgi:hypothetical protein